MAREFRSIEMEIGHEKEAAQKKIGYRNFTVFFHFIDILHIRGGRFFCGEKNVF